MAHPIEFLDLSISSFVNSLSRYQNSLVISYSKKKILTLTIYRRRPLPVSASDQFAVISAATEFRPDLVSFSRYGTPHFWWRIMEFNGIHDIEDFKKGITIRLPESLL